MRKFLLFLVCLVVAITGLALYNHYDVQARGNGSGFDPGVPVLRTPDTRFAALTDFPFEPHYVEIRDPELGALRVHYLDEGPTDGHTVVLLHGQATWSYSFRDMIPLLTAAGYRVIAPDLVGFGRSDKPADWQAHTYQRHVDWLAATLDALSIRGASGFLFDWGGYFGLPVVVDRPEFFDRLLLVTTTLPRANSVTGAVWVAGWRRYTLKPEVFPISRMVSDMTGRELDADTLIGLDAPYPDESYKGGPRRLPMLIPATPLNPAHRLNSRVWKALRNWHKPTLTLISEQLASQGFDPTVFHEQIPGTQGQPHEIYPNRGFFLIEDNPEELAAKTIEFIEQS
ncbi:MAG: haloalkane dehalogenase [Gammaproteobacteria bacterium]|nr:haloalkane dehalogenase [Gammaproteobacteria bacterium]